ncbi:DUF736 family protein [Bordetella hinzii]|uniref:DUF736 domain-containing protein n=1 Tax=Bordetella hinzii TaxID=103855 RepID=A0AAN1RZR7_9BORD|nr:hypothetical protein ACR55_01957 [Bordetella hinzii]AZW19059.1 DUF736 domain-containing protein [Bordetella hinzii]MBZ0073475.1 DUF736 family protein [Bordetella hinzii]MBZ0078049.1 DUF736 family protein [Bordetella hinzii]MBZ0082272.1 DUF736 family protein [Bordetella hinzii]
MANIGIFTADKDGFTGTLRTLTLNVRVKQLPNDKGGNENARDFRLQAASHDIGAAWKKTSAEVKIGKVAVLGYSRRRLTMVC